MAQGEHQFDTQVSTWHWHMSGADLVFLSQEDGYWILQFLLDAQKAVVGKKPTVYSISYGWFENDQCDFATSECANVCFLLFLFYEISH